MEIPQHTLEDLVAELREVKETMDRLQMRLARLENPVLVSPEWLAHRCDCSVQTVMRRAKQWGIPKRDLNGQVKDDNSGPVRFYLAEWERGEKRSTRSVKRAVRRRRR